MEFYNIGNQCWSGVAWVAAARDKIFKYFFNFDLHNNAMFLIIIFFILVHLNFENLKNILNLQYMELFTFEMAMENEEEQDTQGVPEKTKEFRALLKKFQNYQENFIDNKISMRNLVDRLLLKNLNKIEFEKMYKETMDTEIEINDQTKLTFFLPNPKSEALFKKVHYLALPQVNEITVNGISHIDEKTVNAFFSHSIPNNLESLSINFCSSQIEGYIVKLSNWSYFIISKNLLSECAKSSNCLSINRK